MQIKPLLISSIVLSSAAMSSHLQAKPAKQYSPLSVSVTKIATNRAAVGEQGNELQRDQWMFELKSSLPLNKQWFVGAKLGYDQLDYDWTSPRTAYQQGWDKITRYRASASLSYRPNKHWMLMLAPKVQYAATDNASLSEAQSYGAFLTAMYRFDSGNMLGFGVGYLNDINEVRTLPFLAINWKITEDLTLGNPFSAGFSGPAGLELTYAISNDWRVGMGTAKRTHRFLVADDKHTAEIDEWVGFARVGWDIHSSLSVNAYLGYFFNGQLELEPKGTQEELDSQGALALDFTYRF